MESLNEEELLRFLRAEGGRAKNSDMLARYQSLISHADPQLRAHHRQTFKEIINKVAVVKQEDTMDRPIGQEEQKPKKQTVKYLQYTGNLQNESSYPHIVLFVAQGEKYVILKKRYQSLVSDLPDEGELLAPVHPTVSSKTPLPTSGTVLWESESSAAQPSVDVPSPAVEQASPKEKNQSAIPRIHVKDFSAVLQSTLNVQKAGLHAVLGVHPLQRPASSSGSPKGRGRRVVSAGMQDEEEADYSAKETEQEVFEDGGSSVDSASVALDPMEKDWLQGAASGNFTLLSQLVKQEPALAGKKDFTSTALHWAAKHGNAEMVTMLVNAGAEINVRDGYTPLHIAALHGQHQIMNLLISNYGAKETLRDYSGHLPAQYLKSNGLRDATNDTPQFHQVRGERRNRKLVSLFTAKSSSHSKKRWGSAEDLVEEDEEEEKGNPHHLALPTAYLPVSPGPAPEPPPQRIQASINHLFQSH